MTIKAYAYEADIHCIDCTLARHARGGFKQNQTLERTHQPGNDGHGLPLTTLDNEGNFVHPVFDLSEFINDGDGVIRFPSCGTCHAILWKP